MAQPGGAVVPGAHPKGRTPGRVRSVPDLVAAIYEYLDAHNSDPKPFVWTASAEQILDKVRRGRVALQTLAD